MSVSPPAIQAGGFEGACVELDVIAILPDRMSYSLALYRPLGWPNSDHTMVRKTLGSPEGRRFELDCWKDLPGPLRPWVFHYRSDHYTLNEPPEKDCWSCGLSHLVSQPYTGHHFGPLVTRSRP
jgi:hypothetical protein